MNMRKNIGLRLSQARKEKNLTQEQLAERTSFSVSEISRIETGRNDAPLGTLKKLCDTWISDLIFYFMTVFHLILDFRHLRFSKLIRCSSLCRKKIRNTISKSFVPFPRCQKRIYHPKRKISRKCPFSLTKCPRFRQTK